MKKIWKSKTFWLAVLQAVAGIVASLTLELPSIGWLVSVKSIIDIATRLITTDKVSL